MENIKDITCSLIVIRAVNIESTLEFYQTLGLTFTQEQHNDGPIHYSCAFDNLVLEIYPIKPNGLLNSTKNHSTMLGFTVKSLQQTLSKLQNLNIKPKSPPEESAWGNWVIVSDPDGRSVQITEPLKQ